MTFPAAPSPSMRGGQLAGFPGETPLNQGPPEGFARPPNLAQPYTPFDPMKVLEMDELEVLAPPRMPVVLGPHDVYPEDWNRLMQDLALAWSRKLPVPEAARTGRIPKRSAVAGGLVDEWNHAFFYPRGVELVLYKGRERRTGMNVGMIDDLPEFDIDEEDLSSSASDSSDVTDSSLEDRYQYGEYGGVYGRQNDPNIVALREQRRRRREKKAEKKRREKEKKVRRKLKEKEKKYTLYITSVEPQRAAPTGLTGGFAAGMGGGPEW